MPQINRVLLVGLGSIGKRHLGNLKQLLPQAKLIVLRSREGIGEIEGCEVVSDLKVALEFKPQVALICSPSSLHLSVATELAKAGIHLFIEKPLSNKVEGVNVFLEIIQHANIQVMLGYNLRFSKSLLMLREIIESKKYGHAVYASAEVGQYLPDWRPGVDYRSTVSARSELGGGALLELSHELDYMIWLFGDVNTASAKLLKISELEIDVEDLVLAHIDFEKHGRSLSASIQLDFLQRQPYRRCKVVCEKATLVWDAITGLVEVHQKGGSNTIFQDDSDRDFTYVQELRTFIDCIETDSAVPINAQDGLRVLELVDAIRKSSELEKVVYL